MQFNQTLIHELRELAARGVAPSQLILVIGHRLGLEHTNFRLLAIAYFREAFALTLADATRIGAAAAFPNGGRDDALDSELRPIIEGTRHLWAGK
jgi:hypothetical protein